VTFAHRLALAGAIAALGTAVRADAPCTEGARRFCADRAPRQLLSCLQAHRNDLAPACVQRVDRVLVFFQDAAYLCKADAYRFCPSVGPGLPMVDCLREHESELAPSCGQYFATMRARDEAVQRACGDELARSCPGVSAGRGEAWMCVALGAAEVSPACAAAL
jgi:hypothetical protein